ncbi:MAG TPA: RNA polymerase sigma-70 factor [Naasia sp.]
MSDDADYHRHRRLIFGIAYDITGSVMDAEDVTQETYIRWRTAGAVDNPRAYLAKTAANLSLNALRASARRREEYVGPWLPEPLDTGIGPSLPGPEESVLTADAVSTAMLVVLESLSAAERAAFVLREVFDFDYEDIAAALGRSETATRQLVSRARTQVRLRPRRNEVDAIEHRAVLTRFLDAAATGNVQGLLELLAPDAVLTTDGGGKVNAALRPIMGREKVGRFLVGIADRYRDGAIPEVRELNGLLGVVVWLGDEVLATFQLEVEGEQVTSVYVMRNPDKLGHLVKGQPA